MLLSNAMDSPAPVFGDFRWATAPAPLLLFRAEEPLFDRPPGVGGNPVTTGCDSVLPAGTVAFESKSLMVSRTLDFLVDVLAGVRACFVGDPSSHAVLGLLPRADLTGLGLVPSFASSLLGNEMGLGILDLTPPAVRDPFLPPEPDVVLVATLVVVEVARLLFEELPPLPQTQPPSWYLCDVWSKGMSSRRSGVNGRST